MGSTKREKRVERKKRKISAYLALGNGEILSEKRTKCEDFEELRKRLRERKKFLRKFTRFELKERGKDAQEEVPSDRRKPLLFQELQNLLYFSLTKGGTPLGVSSWCKFDRVSMISSMTVLVVEGGLGIEDCPKYEKITSLLPYRLHFVRSHFSIPTEFACLALTRKLKDKFRKKKISALKSAVKKKKLIPFPFMPLPHQASELKMRLLLSAQQMLEMNYPLPIPGFLKNKYSDYVPTASEYSHVTPESPMLSIDCEMCLTSVRKLELTRICIVDEQLNTVYHSLVKPENAIINYLTQYSGITEALLRNVTTTLEDVQKSIKELIPSDAILIGQSLNSDLDALRMMHPYVIDTSVIYNLSGVRKRKSKLSVLSELFLEKMIQNAGPKGHDPVEDAIAAMELVLLKLRKGYSFGDALFENPKVAFLSDHGSSLFQAPCKDKVFKIFGSTPSVNEYMNYLEREDEEEECVIDCSSSDEATSAAISSLDQNDLTICHINIDKNDEKSMSSLKKYTKKFLKATPENSLFIMVWAGSDTQDAFVGILLKEDPEKTKGIEERGELNFSI